MNKLLLAVLLITIYAFLTVEADEEEIRAEKHLEVMKELASKLPEKYGIYKSLIELSENHSQKCDYKEILKFRQEVESIFYRGDSIDLKFYKTYQWKKRVLACRDFWKTNLKNEVETLNELDEKAVNAIKKAVIERMDKENRAVGYRGYFMGQGFAYAAGLTSYLEQIKVHEPKDWLQGKKGKHLLQKDIDEFIMKPCEDVREHLGTMKIYDTFVFSRYTSDNIVNGDEFLKNWLEAVGICKRIVDTRESFLGEIYKRLKEENSKYTKVGKALNCLGLNCKV